MLRDRVVVVGVSGGIAAYKACELVRRLRDRGATVLVVMTQAACEFVTPLTFQALSGNPVVTNLWGDQRPRFDLPLESVGKVRGHVEHVDVAEVAAAVVLAPATADLMARLTHGVAPDALTALVLATPAPILVAPAMDLQMWQNAATQDNVRVLRSRGFRFVGPDSGELASGLTGPGRLAEVNAIVDEVEAMLRVRTSMKGVHVLIGAGRTEEALDPVRVLTNRSSGRMGFALAEAARDRGADVTVVAGPVSVEPPHGVRVVSVTTAVQMERAMREAAGKAESAHHGRGGGGLSAGTCVHAKTQARRRPAHGDVRAQSRIFWLGWAPQSRRASSSWASRSRPRTVSRMRARSSRRNMPT